MIEDRERAETRLAGERRLLEMVASGSPLPVVLDALCRLVEDVAPGCHCSLLLVDPGPMKLQHGAAPSLSPRLCEAIHGRSVVPYWGPCAMAVHEKTQVIVADVTADARWASGEWHGLMLDLGLRSCWTTPILSRAGEVLGTFAIYQNVPGNPTPLHQNLIGQFTHIASIAIERAQTDEALDKARSELARVAREATARSEAMLQGQAELAALRERHASLGRREQEVMELVVSGLLNKQIGARLGISEITVKAHRGKVMRKMQAGSLADLVRMAARLGPTDTFV